MAQYGYGNGGGYETTSYGAAGGANGGGFVGGSQGAGSQSPGQSDKTYGKDTLRPVTIKQLIDATQAHPDAEFKIDNHECTTITFVGQIQTISPQTTNVTYKIDDGTGLIDVKQWIDSDAPQSETQAQLVENAYVRVFGRLKSFSQKRHVGSHVIRPSTDLNEISMHLLQATAVHLYFTRGPPGSLTKSEDDGNGLFVGQANGSGGGEPRDDKAAIFDAMGVNARKVYKVLQSFPQNNEGLHVHIIAEQAKLGHAEVFKAGDELLASGQIYTTVDDETWAVLDY